MNWHAAHFAAAPYRSIPGWFAHARPYSLRFLTFGERQPLCLPIALDVRVVEPIRLPPGWMAASRRRPELPPYQCV